VEESWQLIDFHAASCSRGRIEKGEDDSLCTDAVVDVVLLNDRAGLQHVEDVSLHDPLVRARRHDLPDEEGVVPADVTLDDPALDVAEALLYPGRLDLQRGYRREPRLGELVHVPPRLHAAVVHLLLDGDGGHVDDELAGLLDEPVAVALGGDPDADHRRPDADGHVHP
jgi:hypothetical protein